jgi:vitamin B12 transporter
MFGLKKYITHISLLLAILLPGGFQLLAQTAKDTALVLPAVEVFGNRKERVHGGIKVEKLDSNRIRLAVERKLSDFLENNTVFYCKNYGPGNLSTLSIRGTTSSQSGVYWNGFDFKSPGAGMIDLSLVPVLFFNKIEAFTGGYGDIKGNNNIGGAVHLGNYPLLGDADLTSAGFSLGSFGEFQQQGSLEIRRNHWGCKTTLYHYNTLNNYTYKYDKNQYTRKHAGIDQFALMHNFETRWDKHYLDLGLWIQGSDRQLPVSLTSADNNADRADKSVRFTSRWRKHTAWGTLSAGLACFGDRLRYREIPGDTLVLLDSRISNTAVMADFSLVTDISRLKTVVTTGVNLNYNHINIHSFGGRKEQKQGSIHVALTQPLFHSLWEINLAVKQEAVTAYQVPPELSLGLEGRIIRHFGLRFNLARTSRLPTMNDRFWIPGGNEDLKPESGTNISGGMFWKRPGPGGSQAEVSVDGFHSEIDDWISWVPSSNGYFMAMNVQEVKVNGLDISGAIVKRISAVTLTLKASLSLLDAFNNKKLNVYDQSEGKQLIYTPRSRMNGFMNLQWRSFLLSYDHSYTGDCYTDRENTDIVKAFNRADFQLQYMMKADDKWSFSFRFGIDNLWDTRYEIVKYFPMPGRSYRFGITANLNHTGRNKLYANQ